MKAIALVLIARVATTSFALDSKDVGRRITALGNHETSRIVYHSKGCFNDETYTFRINGSTPDKMHVSGPKVKVAVSITAEDRENLDKSLEFYRKKVDGECTTTDSITVYWMKYGVPVSRESFEDSTCTQTVLRKFVMKITAGPSITQGKTK